MRAQQPSRKRTSDDKIPSVPFAAPPAGLSGLADALFSRGRPALRKWFSSAQRGLPWRRAQNSPKEADLPADTAPGRAPYASWVSEIMLQQTQVASVVPRFEAWIRRFPTVRSLAAAPEREVLRAWAGLGYYARARNLHKGARWIVQQGKWPVSAAEWRDVPGVGEYTAGALASIVFGQRAPLLDGNAARVFSRLLGLGFLPGDGAAQRRAYWQVASVWADAEEPGVLNEALMELGALVCTPLNPHCDACPLKKECRARRAGWTRRLPPPRARARPQNVATVAVVARRAGRVLLETRPAGAFLAGHAMFPLFHAEEAKDWRAVFRARFGGLEFSEGALAGSFRHAIMAKRYEVEVWTVIPRPASAASGWVSTRSLGKRLSNSLARKIWALAGGD